MHISKVIRFATWVVISLMLAIRPDAKLVEASYQQARFSDDKVLSHHPHVKGKHMSSAQSILYLNSALSSISALPASSFTLPAPLLWDGSVGNTSTGYNVSGPLPTISVLYDLGAGSGIAVGSAEVAGTLGNFSIALFYSNNGTTWTQVTPTGGSWTNGVSRNFSAGVITARYWQFEFYSIGGGTVSDARLFEASGGIGLIDGPSAVVPTAPPVPTFGTTNAYQIPVIVPALTGGATSYDLQRASDVSGTAGTWATIQGSVTTSSTFTDTPLNDKTTFWYRLVATNSAGITNGPAASATTTPIPIPNLSGEAILIDNVPAFRLFVS